MQNKGRLYDDEKCRRNSLNKGFLGRILLSVTILTLMLQPLTLSYGQSGGRQAEAQTQKIELIIDLDKLKLKWNGDKGEAGRGNGEVSIYVVVFFPGATEEKEGNVKQAMLTWDTFSAFKEFPSGEIVEDPSGSKKIVPATVSLPPGQEGKTQIRIKADCPLPSYITIYAYVWEDDTSATIEEVKKLLEKFQEIISMYVKKYGPLTNVANILLGKLIDLIITSGEDSLGKVLNKDIIFTKDPCADDGKPMKMHTEIDLETMVNESLWDEAEDKNGEEFKEAGIPLPETIGSLELDITAHKLVNQSSSHSKKDDPPSIKELRMVNLGRVEEDVIAGQLYLGAPIPFDEPLSIDYNFYLDIDNNLATGAQYFPARGAEFIMQFAYENTTTPIARLLKFNSQSNLFEEVTGGMHDSGLSLDRSTIYLATELSTLGEVTYIAGWGVIEDESGIVDILPENPEEIAPVITIKGVKVLIHPNPVFLHDKMQIEVSKTDISRGDAVSISEIVITKPSGEELLYKAVPIDITGSSVVIPFPSNDWINGDPQIDQVGPWSLNVVVTTLSGSGFVLTSVEETSFYTSFHVKPEFPAGIFAIAAPLGTLVIYGYRRLIQKKASLA